MSQKEVSRCEERHFTQRVQELLDMSRVAGRIGEGDQHMRTNKIPVYSMELERISGARVIRLHLIRRAGESTRPRSIHCLDDH